MNIEDGLSNQNSENNKEIIIDPENITDEQENIAEIDDDYLGISQAAINKLQLQRDGITSFKDLTRDDGKILAELDKQIKLLKDSQIEEFESKKQKIFKTADTMQGAWSETGKTTISPEKVKQYIEEILEGKRDLRFMPTSIVLSSNKTWRKAVKELLTLQEKYLSEEDETVH